MDSLSLGQRLRLVRQNKGLTQKKVADKLGIRPPSLCAYEKDQSEPNMETLRWYSRYFHVSADWLLGLEDENHVENTGLHYQRRSSLEVNSEPPLSDEELRTLRLFLQEGQIKRA